MKASDTTTYRSTRNRDEILLTMHSIFLVPCDTSAIPEAPVATLQQKRPRLPSCRRLQLTIAVLQVISSSETSPLVVARSFRLREKARCRAKAIYAIFADLYRFTALGGVAKAPAASCRCCRVSRATYRLTHGFRRHTGLYPRCLSIPPSGSAIVRY